MQRAKIVIASVLKPLKDPRAFYKMALSLRETSKYHINIIGFSTKNETDENNIKFTPLFYKKRNSLARFSAGIRFLKELIRYKPKVVIVSTYELLPAAVFAKVILNFKLVYDVQENYSLNLQFNQSSIGHKKKLAIHLVKTIEAFAHSAIDLFIFAEKCYVDEFPRWKPYLILENKFSYSGEVNRQPFPSESTNLEFLLTGTLTPAFGTLDGITWFLEFNKRYPTSHLNVIGHVPLENYRKELESMIEDHTSISYQLSDFPLPYSQIVEAISSSEILLLPYRQLPSIAPKIPSKLYEGCALGKLIIHTPNTHWKNLVDQYGQGLELDFLSATNFEEVFNFLSKPRRATPPTAIQVYWKSIEHEFLAAIAKLAAF